MPLMLSGSANAATMSQWDATAQLESGGDWAINYSSDGLSVGGLQFQNPSWHDALAYLNSKGYDTSSWTQNLYQGMPRSSVPTKDQTILAGEALLHIQGAGAWANGNASGAVSMFNGGPNPWGLPGTEWPGNGGSGATSGGSTPTPTPDPTTSTSGGSTASGHRHHHGSGSTTVTPTPVSSGTTPVPAAPSANGSHKTYVVQPGDCLSEIALANGYSHWGPLYQLNIGVVGANPDLIFPGQVLML